jgi:hypothetical protein
MAKKLKKILKSFLLNLLSKWLEDIFILAGVAVIIGTTYSKFGMTIGNYLLGFVFLVFGFLFAKK